jgi:hypothetical protein
VDISRAANGGLAKASPAQPSEKILTKEVTPFQKKI